jgi:hypothetical protein
VSEGSEFRRSFAGTMTDFMAFINFMLKLFFFFFFLLFFFNLCLLNYLFTYSTLQLSSVVDLACTPRSRHVLHSVRLLGGGGVGHFGIFP